MSPYNRDRMAVIQKLSQISRFTANGVLPAGPSKDKTNNRTKESPASQPSRDVSSNVVTYTVAPQKNTTTIGKATALRRSQVIVLLLLLLLLPQPLLYANIA